MIKVSAFLFWTLAEVALVLVALLLIIAIYAWWRRRSDQAAARRLIARVKQAMPQREAEMEQILTQSYGYEGERLEQAKINLRKGEMAVYKALLRLYLKRDSRFLTQWHLILEDALAQYRRLEVPKVMIQKEAKGPSIDVSELEALRQRNLELTDELRVTMDTMGRVLGEYSGMFSREEDDSVVLEINEDQIAKPRAPVTEAAEKAQDDIFAALSAAAPEAEVTTDAADMDWGAALAEQAAGEGASKASGGDDLDWGAALAEQAAGEGASKASGDDDLDWGAALAEQAAGEGASKASGDDDLDWGAALAEQAAAEAKGK